MHSFFTIKGFLDPLEVCHSPGLKQFSTHDVTKILSQMNKHVPRPHKLGTGSVRSECNLQHHGQVVAALKFVEADHPSTAKPSVGIKPETQA